LITLDLNYKTSDKEDLYTFYAERKKLPYFGAHWHYHKELEILFTIKAEGLRIIGDNIDHFANNELVLIGSDIPHLFKNDENKETEPVDYIVIKFSSIFEKTDIFSLPEFYHIARFLEISKRGILFSKITTDKVMNKIIQLPESKGPKRIILLLSILSKLSKSDDYLLLSSDQFSMKTSVQNEGRIQNVIDYIGKNYTVNITLNDLADVAHMTTNSFCRYFKNRSGKTVFQFIREYRINIACQMLINGKDKSISDICYETGFNSFSTFNRIFKSLKNISASEYRSKYIELHK
jgi:AraC-like DNA-binding protein